MLEIKGIFKRVSFSPLFSLEEPGAEREFRDQVRPKPRPHPLLILPRHQALGMPLVITVARNHIFKSSIFLLGSMHECTTAMSHIHVIFLLF